MGFLDKIRCSVAWGPSGTDDEIVSILDRYGATVEKEIRKTHTHLIWYRGASEELFHLARKMNIMCIDSSWITHMKTQGNYIIPERYEIDLAELDMDENTRNTTTTIPTPESPEKENPEQEQKQNQGVSLSAYEQLRLDNIARNQEFLASIGIAQCKPTIESNKKESKTKSKKSRCRHKHPGEDDFGTPPPSSRKSARLSIRAIRSSLSSEGISADEDTPHLGFEALSKALLDVGDAVHVYLGGAI